MSWSHPMISFHTMLLPFALLGFSGEAVAQGWGADWEVIGVAQDRTQVLVRPVSVRDLPPTNTRGFAVRQVWAGFDFFGATSLDRGKRIVLFQYDCAGQRALIAAATDYASDGAVLARNAVTSDETDQYEPVQTGTLNAAIMSEACKF
jgi:hypothetical protein